ncbi:MAG: hypothetical protein ACON5B_08465 [Myxococcota bacterium]
MLRPHGVNVMVYIVHFALQGPHEDYPQFFDALKALGPWSNRMGDTWILECRLSSIQIRDLLKAHIRPGDRIFVAEFIRNWAGTGMGAGFPEWMQRRGFRELGPAPASTDDAGGT